MNAPQDFQDTMPTGPAPLWHAQCKANACSSGRRRCPSPGHCRVRQAQRTQTLHRRLLSAALLVVCLAALWAAVSDAGATGWLQALPLRGVR